MAKTSAKNREAHPLSRARLFNAELFRCKSVTGQNASHRTN